MSVKLALPAALLAVLSFSACQDDEVTSAADPSSDATTDTSSESPTESTEETQETEETEGSDDGGEGASAGAVTAPGTELSIGATAVLPLTYGTDGTATVEVTVTGIREGTAADLEAAKVEDAADYTPFYIDLDMKILSVGAEGFGGYTAGSDFDGLIGSQKAGSLIVIGDFAPCDGDGFEYDSAVGDTAKGCVPALATKGSVVDGVQFVGGGSDSPYNQFEGEPVVWK